MLLTQFARATEVFPAVPTQYATDYAGVLKQSTVSQLNDNLRQFEKNTSSQIVVAVLPKLDSDRPYDDYSIRLFNAWKIGQKGKDNGIGLFVYVKDHKVFICTGKGMEGPLPDAMCFAIISNEITPRFKAGDFDGGLTAGVNAIEAATRGEYKGTGTTVDERNNGGPNNGGANGNFPIPTWLFVTLIILVFVLRIYFGGTGYTMYGNAGRWGGGGFGGGSFGGGGGGFSGGGGSSGGGGAGGSW